MSQETPEPGDIWYLRDLPLGGWLRREAGVPPTLYALTGGPAEWFCEAWCLWRSGKSMPGGNAVAMEEAAGRMRAGTRPR